MKYLVVSSQFKKISLHIFQKHEVSLSHIESRPSVRDEGDYEFMVEFCAGEYGDVKGCLDEIKKQSTYCKIISREETEGKRELRSIT